MFRVNARGNHRMKVRKISAMIISWCVPIVIPLCHIVILWHFWRTVHFPVYREGCICDCWDSVFKGPYESGISSYKHFYFNATKEMLKIWIVVITGIVAIYECTKYCAYLFISNRLRYSMLVLIVASIYPHYYSWWNYINYINDGFYDEWSHQLFYTSTEIISTGVALQLANVQCKIKAYKLLIIIAVGMAHIMGAGLDQFVLNLIFMQGRLHQVLRDCGLLFPDMLNVIIPLQLLVLMKKDLRFGRFKRVLKDKPFILQVLLAIAFILGSLCILYDSVDVE